MPAERERVKTTPSSAKLGTHEGDTRYIEKLKQQYEVRREGKWDGHGGRHELERKLRSQELAHPEKRISINHEQVHNEEQLNEVLAESEAIYTDDSKSARGAGAAWIHLRRREIIEQKLIKASPCCSIFRIEAEAIKSALEYASELSNGIYICTDSRSVLEAMKNRSCRHQIINRIQRLTAEMEHEVRFVWTKAHVGIEGNEHADEAAKSAAELTGEPSINECPMETVKLELKKRMDHAWETRYESTTKAKHLKEIICTIEEAKEWREATELNFFLTQMLTGHGGTMEYLKKFKIVNTNRCTCGQVQSREHILLECPLTRKIYDEAKRKLSERAERVERIRAVAECLTKMMKKIWDENQLRITQIRQGLTPMDRFLITRTQARRMVDESNQYN